MAVETPTWKYKLEGDKQTASEMNQLAQSVIANAIELSNIEELVTNLADDDDLENTIINGVPVIREKTTKTYNPENYSGMGRVILRKNMVNGVNVLIQAMINQANTVYEIRYDFDLNGAEITIPEGCVLDFQGGSLNNGTLRGTINVIGDYLKHINVLFKGDNITKDFGLTNYTDEVVNSQIESALNGVVVYEDVHVGNECYLKTSIESPYKSKVYFKEYTRGFLLFEANNISIKNIEIIKSIPITEDGVIRYRQNVYIENCSNITIENCKLNGSIDINSVTEEQNNIIINKNYFDCDFSNIKDTGDNFVQKDVIQILGTKDVWITNNYIKSKNVNRVFKTSSRTNDYVDIVLVCRNIYIENNTIISDCELGKQMYDMFCATTDVFFRGNYVKISGFSRIIENKSVDATIQSNIHIVDNYIEHINPRSDNFYFAFENNQNSFLNFSNNTIITTGQNRTHYINFRGVNLQFNNNIYKGDNSTTFYLENAANQVIFIENNFFNNSRFFISNNIVANTVNFISNKSYRKDGAFISLYRESVVNSINLINNIYESVYLLSIVGNGNFNSNVHIISDIYNSEALLQGDKDGDLVNKIDCSGGLLLREGKGYKANEHSISSFDALKVLYKAKEGTVAKHSANGDLFIKSSNAWILLAKTLDTKTSGTEEEKPVLSNKNKGYAYWNTTTNCLNIWTGYRWVGVDGYNPQHYSSGEFPSTTVPNGFICFRLDLKVLCIFIDGNWYKIPTSCNYAKDTSGAWDEKPNRVEINNAIGFAYFCTDKQTVEGATNGIMIYHKGNNVWVDALGRVVS